MDYSRYYLRFHDDTPQHRLNRIAHYRRILTPHLPEKKDAQFLDVGCGMGFAMHALLDMGYTEVTGVDCDETQFMFCKNGGLNVTLSKDTVGFLETRTSTYECVLCLDVIEHIPVGAQLSFVAAVLSSLQPGGKLICTVPNANSAVAARWRYNDWTHTSSFTEHSLDFLLFNAGFRKIQIVGYELAALPRTTWLPVAGARRWWVLRFFRLLRRLEMIAELGRAQGRTIPLSLNLFGVATRPSSDAGAKSPPL